jgi:SAM-dependent methyltransferase
VTRQVGAAEWDRRYAGAEPGPPPEPNEHVAGLLAGLPPGRALDLGCGRGRHARWLARRGWQVVAVDFSAVALAQGRADAGALAIDWQQADLAGYRPQRPFDLVVLAFVHLGAAERGGLLRTAAAALRDGGLLVLAGFHPDHARAGLGGGPRERDKLLDPDILAAELAAAGLVPVSVRRLASAEAVQTVVAAQPAGRP